MKHFRHILFLMLVLSMPSLASAQQVTSVAVFPQAQLDQMVAPIALYPDPLVAQILMAATYPLEIVEAGRWQQNSVNAQLQGDQLAMMLEQMPWDPSVKSLVPFPQILQTLNQNIEWTEQLGNAFLTQPVDVENAIQQLRYAAEQSGALQSTPQQTVSTQGAAIVILPTNPAIVYVPYYNPDTVYGDWRYPDYQPYSFSNDGNVVGFGLGFATGIAVIEPLWFWNSWDWRHHRINIDNHRFARLNEGRQPERPNVWQHDVDHRHGVPYVSPATQQRFNNRVASPTFSGENFRGYEQRYDQRREEPRYEQHREERHDVVPQIQEPRRVAGPRPVVSPVPAFNRSVPQQVQPQQVQPQRQEPVREIPRPQMPQPMQAAPQILRQAPQVQTPVQHVEPQQAPRAAPAFESFAHGPEVRQQQQRGFESRAPAPQAHPAGPNAGPQMEHERH